ncbi:MAG TPA: cation transporter, partial [Acidimicrobiia bacterium]|nr:cation transporter [Acidimicrobiia bacterium]
MNLESKGVEMRDPVCGMTVGPGALQADGYPGLGFCSEHCRRRFLADPEQYIEDTASDDGADSYEEETAGVPTADPPGRTERAGTIHLAVAGMTCASCVSTVESALAGVPGVIDARVNFAANTATVDTAVEVPASVLTAAVVAAGYRAIPIHDETNPETDTEQAESHSRYRLLMRKFWFAAAVSLPVIYFSYPQIFPGVPNKGSTALWWIWVAMGILTIPVLAWSGSQFFTGAWGPLKHRSANMHT